ncbi:MAG: sigma-54-dependent Fis family transcriptional regulator [Pyrinomonadaceae bacterium]|nr:sigma-54-dependent Fis family transcriptional regulator [Phycisphaerales bacterium]
MPKILVIEDEENLRFSIRRTLSKAGHLVFEASCLREARDLTHQHEFDLVLSDIMLGSESGIDFVRELRQDGFEGVASLMTGHGTFESAVQALRDGADDYLTKPLVMSELIIQSERWLAQRRLVRRLKLYERLELTRESTDELVGQSEAWKKTLSLAERLATIPIQADPPMAAASSQVSPGRLVPTNGLGLAGTSLPCILLLGETGVGKGVLARYIHMQASALDAPGLAPRDTSAPPFVHVNCSALPASLVEAELFGHEKGAFTDAAEPRAGLFEMADGGTIFLDEISEMPHELQAKLLLVVEHGVFRRVGGSKERSVRARVIAASNQDLDRRAETGGFRRDLLYRLNAFTVRIPPLREREHDAVLIAKAMLDRLARRYGRAGLKLGDTALQAIRAHTWPGNVRELVNAVQRAAMLCDKQVIEPVDLGLAISPPIQETIQTSAGTTQALVFDFIAGIHTAEEVEKALIQQALEHTKGNVSRAAKLVGLQRSSLRYRIERYQLDKLTTEVAKP